MSRRKEWRKAAKEKRNRHIPCYSLTPYGAEKAIRVSGEARVVNQEQRNECN